MKTKTKEIVIRKLEFKGCLEKGEKNYYIMETDTQLNLHALQHVITEYEKIPERLDEFMVLHEIGYSQILEFLNNNYKKQ